MTGERPGPEAVRPPDEAPPPSAGPSEAEAGRTTVLDRPRIHPTTFEPDLRLDWRGPALAISGLVGYTGTQRTAQARRLDRLFGSGVWRIAWRTSDAVIEREEALQLYEDAYLEFLSANGDVLDWLCRSASEVYDNALTNVASGLDYAVQEAASTHLQDIAVRRCLERLGRRFEGDHLVEIRGVSSEGHRLNPGLVPFHRPAEIVASEERSWWGPESVEAFWQHNKVVVVAPEAVSGRPVLAGADGIWVDLDGETCLLAPREHRMFLPSARRRTLRRRTNGPAGTRSLSRITEGPETALPFARLEEISRSSFWPGSEARVAWQELVGERASK